MLTQTACRLRRSGLSTWRGDGLRKGTKRRVYKPMDLESMLKLAASRAALLPQKELQEFREMELGHMNALRSGAGTMKDLVEVESMADISIEMANRGIGPEALVPAKLLKLEIDAAKVMLEQEGRCVLSGVGLRAMQDTHEYHDLQRQSIPRKTYEDCIFKVMNRERTGKR